MARKHWTMLISPPVPSSRFQEPTVYRQLQFTFKGRRRNLKSFFTGAAILALETRRLLAVLHRDSALSPFPKPFSFVELPRCWTDAACPVWATGPLASRPRMKQSPPSYGLQGLR
ncbi:uncharacterized protein LOC143667193 [Tamandua tetradactyla]|uniref:uncharacterized protein LOC143667193 n=1 Tax=Tamandua tetradactyla TaxID=48850 RepID=UPI004053B66C